MMEMEIERLREENMKLKRDLAFVKGEARRYNIWWPFFDYNQAYGGGSGETEN